MEQINKGMKVTGRIIGLTQKSNALKRYCLNIPDIISLSKECHIHMKDVIINKQDQHVLE